MNNKKDVLMFGNKAQMKDTNWLIKAGISAIIGGVITLMIGGRSFYKSVWAIQGEDPTSNVINGMFEDLTKTSK